MFSLDVEFADGVRMFAYVNDPVEGLEALADMAKEHGSEPVRTSSDGAPWRTWYPDEKATEAF